MMIKITIPDNIRVKGITGDTNRVKVRFFDNIIGEADIDLDLMTGHLLLFDYKIKPLLKGCNFVIEGLAEIKNSIMVDKFKLNGLSVVYRPIPKLDISETFINHENSRVANKSKELKEN